jgi:hypothetical protein
VLGFGFGQPFESLLHVAVALSSSHFGTIEYRQRANHMNDAPKAKGIVHRRISYD